MKIKDLCEDEITLPKDENTRLYLLKRLIDDNKKPKVIDAGWSRDYFSLGDVEKLGYGKYHRNYKQSGTVEQWFAYFGPYPIAVDGKRLLYPGEETEPTESQYT